MQNTGLPQMFKKLINKFIKSNRSEDAHIVEERFEIYKIENGEFTEKLYESVTRYD
jgi:molybdopterin-biosynthesis enzyme MoeA-like protein